MFVEYSFAIDVFLGEKRSFPGSVNTRPVHSPWRHKFSTGRHSLYMLKCFLLGCSTIIERSTRFRLPRRPERVVREDGIAVRLCDDNWLVIKDHVVSKFRWNDVMSSGRNYFGIFRRHVKSFTRPTDNDVVYPAAMAEMRKIRIVGFRNSISGMIWIKISISLNAFTFHY